ncbi:hypothetical protein BKA56DRAFT_688586 [Ilyonectria sp. MPI-CAGE-AT-0026]|nr:hypothetical protein BKA56DRAFT_688586 [Ilyonectria sp. MPI-CAGE-AT-0026]
MPITQTHDGASPSFDAAGRNKSPARPPPPGVTPDLQHPSGPGHNANLIGFIVCISVGTVFFALRSYVKIRIVRNSFLEDVTCTIAWALITVYSATALLMNHHGGGYHVWDISPEAYSQVLKWLYASSIAYCPAAFFTKATLLLLIARVFAVEERVSRAIYAFIIFIFILYLPIQVLKTVICDPIRSYWDEHVMGHCLNQRKIFLVDLSVAILTDLVILLLPISLTWHLRFPFKTKMKVVALLGAGGVAVATTVYRMCKAVAFMHTNDPSADIIPLDLSTIVELTIGLICACLPALNMLFQHRPKPRPDPNSPRTRNRKSWPGWRGKLASSSTGTNMTRHSKSQGAEPFRHGESEAASEVPVNFDIELAMLSKGVHNANTDTATPAEECPEQEHGFVGERATSLDGRREGWLISHGDKQQNQ